jgi:hypothetical protein
MQSHVEKGKKDEIKEALQRVLTGHSFRSTPQCQTLLRYIVEHSLSEEIDMLRERQIGINVFGRAPDYDTGNDPVVRARAAEVRKRLAQHYLHQNGVDEEIQIEIPSGSYRAVFEMPAGSGSGNAHREAEKSGEPTKLSADSATEPRPPIEDTAGKTRSSLHPQIFSPFRFSWPQRIAPATMHGGVTLAAAVVIAILGFGAGYGTETYRSQKQRDTLDARHASAPPDNLVAAFWTPFLREDPSPIIVYSDAMFLIDNSGNLFRYRYGAADDRGDTVVPSVARQYASSPALVKAAGDLFYDNGYTGTGDLRAVVALVALFNRMGASPGVESSHELTADDLKRHNVIIVGGSTENIALAQLVPTGDFQFANPDSHDPWSGALINTRPKPGEQPVYRIGLDPVTHRVIADYAVISFQPGLVPGRHIVVLAGIDTTGCDGAALVVTSNAGVNEISNALLQMKMVGPPHEPTATNDLAFQTLVHVDVARGYQVLGAYPVSVRPFNTSGPSIKSDLSRH